MSEISVDKRWIPLWLVIVLASLLTSAATAQGGRSTAQQLEAIRARMETGLALFVAGKSAEAAQQFEAGFAEQPYSAFLFNAAVCYQKMGNDEKALEHYREYLRIDPNAPDIDKVRERIAALEARRQQQPPPPPPPPPDAGPDAAPPPPPPPPPPAEDIPVTEDVMRSLVVVETEPPGAPLKVYRTDVPAPAAFQYGAANPQWKEIVTTVSPTSLSLSVGRYHIVVDKFRDFHVSETDIVVRAGHVHHFKANLSQGVFMSFLRVSANVKGAHVWLDDMKKARPEWGTTPYGELVPAGPHKVLIEAPGFQPIATTVNLEHGEQKELEVRLMRVDYGVVRLDANAPEVKVRIDGEPKGVWRSGEAPLDIRTSSGKHQLIVESSGHKTLETMIDVPRGQVLPVHAKMIPKYPRGAAWTQAILAAAFIGAGAFFGDQSNRLHDQVEADKQAGVLEEDDGRITQGRIYAIGANGAFVVGGVLAILSTYNFIKDPLPESRKELDAPVEFEDPLAKRPTASNVLRRRNERRALGPQKKEPASNRLQLGPQVSENGAGFFVGGSF